jgi:phage shock protein E
MKIFLLLAILVLGALAAAAQTPDKTGAVKHVDAKQAEKLISDHKVTILDIRTPGEFKSGHIAGATNIDFNSPDFEKAITRLSKTNSYLVHCAVGGRSTRSLKLFEKNHFDSIYHLDGGIQAWEKAGLPTEK